MKNLVSTTSGIIFAIGLVLSGMVSPKKVIGFLDVFGSWDYALAFVMGGAVITNLILFKFILSRNPIYCKNHSLPLNNAIDKNLVLGSMLFGIGWGLVGICPGPGIVNLVTLEINIFYFMGALILGMFFYNILKKRFIC